MRVGIIGSGFMSKTHAKAWMKTPAAVAGVLTIDAAAAADFADQFDCKIYTSLSSLLEDVDVVDICVPTHLHHEFVMAAAAAGKQIICEKPLARTLEQAQEMISACRAHDVHLLVAHVVRFFPEYARAKSIVDSGDIGQPAVIRLTRCSFKPAASSPSSWFHDFAKSGGMILDLMIHDFDYARWIAGEVRQVFTRSARQHDPSVDADYALVILNHENGAISHVEGGWALPPPLFRTSLEIAGDQGLIEHPSGISVPLEIHLRGSAEQTPEIAVPTSPLSEDPYETEIAHFYDVLAYQAHPRVTAEDALAALHIALAAIESAETRRPVLLKDS